MSLLTQFQSVEDKINRANELCDFILNGKPYIEVEYIQSAGTQYIDTGIYANSELSVELSAKMDLSTSPYHRGFFIGGWDGTSVDGQNRYGFRMYDGSVYFYTASTGWPATSVNASVQHIYKTVKNILYIDGVQSVTATAGTFTGNHTMFLCVNNKNGTPADYSKLTIYYCKIWNGNTLVRDFIPVKLATGYGALYDKVSKEFFTNQGTGDFVAGPEI